MKIIAVMPIKLINERCPGKNIRLLGNKPLLQYELDSLIETNLCDNIFVFCSDDSILRFLPKGVAYLKRSSYLDLPTSNFNQIFAEFMNKVDSDIYVYAHATAPFVSVETIKRCIKAVVSGEYDSAFCAIKLQDYLWTEKGPLNFDASNLPRTQDLPVIFQETSGVYVFKKEVFLQYGRRVGIKPYICEVNSKEAIDIDEPEDFEFAELVEKASHIKG